MGLAFHVLLLLFHWPRLSRVKHVSPIHHAICFARISSVSLVLCLGRTAHSACMKCATHRMPLMVPLRLQAVREDHFQKVLLERPSDGPILVAVGRHRSVRSSGATPLHVGFAVLLAMS